MIQIRIDHGWTLISDTQARKLAKAAPGSGGRLPAVGHEALILWEGQPHWLARTRHQGKEWWGIRVSTWRMVDGRLRLDAESIRAADLYELNKRV